MKKSAIMDFAQKDSYSRGSTLAALLIAVYNIQYFIPSFKFIYNLNNFATY